MQDQPTEHPSPVAPEPLRLGPDDAGELLTVQRSAYAEQARLHRDPALPPLTETLDGVLAVLTDPASVVLGLRRPTRHGDRLVAAVRLRRIELPDGAGVELGRLVVVPDLQGFGLGSALLRAAHEAASRPPLGPARRIELFTGEHSAANLRLYARFGYRRTHHSDSGSGYRLIHMSRPL